MKKLISLILVMVLLCVCVVHVSAFEPLPESEYRIAVEAELLPKLSAYISERTDKNNITEVNYLSEGEVEGGKYYLINFYSEDKVKKDIFYRIGIYAVNGEYEFPVFADGYAVYTEMDDQWYPLEYLYTIDADLFDVLAFYDSQGISGTNSVNYITAYAGCSVSISTATEIQKYLAGMEIKGFITDERVKFLDIDNDGDITIKDATTLQKYIAGLEIYVHDSIV